MAEYYAQRATAGVIISEATSVSPMGLGYADTPGIWSDEQTEGWKLITRAVHAAGGKIAMQILHAGRYAYHPLSVAPSGIAWGVPLALALAAGKAASLGFG